MVYPINWKPPDKKNSQGPNCEDCPGTCGPVGNSANVRGPHHINHSIGISREEIPKNLPSENMVQCTDVYSTLLCLSLINHIPTYPNIFTFPKCLSTQSSMQKPPKVWKYPPLKPKIIQGSTWESSKIKICKKECHVSVLKLITHSPKNKDSQAQ